jgi:hypothetical protein
MRNEGNGKVNFPTAQRILLALFFGIYIQRMSEKIVQKAFVKFPLLHYNVPIKLKGLLL